jgi:homospermidine synthase
MHITMVKKRLADGSECRKCQEAVAYLESRGLWCRIDEIVWAHEDDDASPGMVLCQQHSVDRAPFFIVRDDRGEAVYCSVLQLVRERLDTAVTAAQHAQTIDADDIGGI